jgi:hypothetical protein
LGDEVSLLVVLLSDDEDPDPSEDGVFSFADPADSFDDAEDSEEADVSEETLSFDDEADSLAAGRLSFL